MTRDKYSPELHELIDALNEHQRLMRNQLTVVLSAFVFPLIIICLVGIWKFASKLPETDRQLKEKIRDIEHYQDIDRIHIKRLYLNDFGVNPYERGINSEDK